MARPTILLPTVLLLAVLLPAPAAGRAAAEEPVRADAPAEAPAEADAVPESDTEKAKALLRRFFREEDAEARRRLAAAFAEVAPDRWDALKAMLHQTAPRPDLAPGTHEFETPGDARAPAVRYLLRVPEGYEPNAPAGSPLVVACHWTDSTADRAMAWIRWVLGQDLNDYLVACPDSPDPGAYRPSRETDTHPLRVLADVRRRVNVNSDRVVLTGYSRGGYQTWATALFSPGRWAGAVPIASAPVSEAGLTASTMYLENVLTLPIQAHWGDRDKVPGQVRGINTLSRKAARWFKTHGAEHFEPVEYEGQGHDLDLRRETIRAFVARVRRDPFPRQVRLLFHRLYQGRAYGVRATKTAAPEIDFHHRVPVRGVRRPEDVGPALARIWKRKGYHLTVRMPAGKNLIAVMARNLAEVEVDLPAERLDFSRPVHVLVNHRTRYGKVHPVDWVCLLETARRTWDFERLVAGRVTARAR